MQTKAELEEEITRLKARVAELEGAVEAYRFALSQLPSYPYPNTWPGLYPQWFTETKHPDTPSYYQIT